MKRKQKDSPDNDLHTMSKQQLIDIIVNQDQEIESHRPKYNKVSALDFSVESENEDLNTCISALNNLIKENKDFKIMRKVKQNLDNNLGVG